MFSVVLAEADANWKNSLCCNKNVGLVFVRLTADFSQKAFQAVLFSVGCFVRFYSCYVLFFPPFCHRFEFVTLLSAFAFLYRDHFHCTPIVS